MLTHMTLKSRNAKTGDIPVSTTSAESCPTSCPFNNMNAGGCYAASGPLGMHWAKVTNGERGEDWESFCNSVESLPTGQLWRHNQSGDLPGKGNAIDFGALSALVSANKGKRGFTYTHKPMTNKRNRNAIRKANDGGFTINLSANNLSHADTLADLEIAPVVTVLPSDTVGKTLKTPQGRKVIVCPATYRDDVTCKSCGLCQKNRAAIVGFPAHGVSKKRASAIATGRVLWSNIEV